MVSFRNIGLLALAAGGLVEAQAKVKIMALGDSITGSPVRKHAVKPLSLPRILSKLSGIRALLTKRAGLLAGPPLAEAPGRRHPEHGLCRDAPWAGLWLQRCRQIR